MGEIIYYEKNGEYICNDDRVEKFWFFGAMPSREGSKAYMYASFIFKDGSRYEHKITEPDYINEAEQFLMSIKSNEQ